jgi:NitT/TauT family transport system substrate-binding protein
LTHARLNSATIVALLAAFACLMVAGSSSAATDEGTAIRTLKISGIAPAIQPGILHIFIGRYLGYYREQNLDIEYQPAAGASDAIQRLLSKNVDLSLGTTDALFALRKQGIDLPLKMVYQYAPKTPYQLAVLPDSSITKFSQLRGKKIGIISYAETGYFYARAALAVSGVKESEVTFIPLGQGPALGNALSTHQVDAIATARQIYVNLRNAGVLEFKLVAHPNKLMANSGNGGILARNDELRSPTMKKAIVGYATALAKSTIFAIANPNAACRIYFELYPQNLSPSSSYAKNLSDCQNTWGVSRQVNDPRNAGKKRWGVIDSHQWRAYGKVMGYGTVSMNDLLTNEVVNTIAKTLNVAAIERQAKAFCTQAGNRALCAKT